MALSFVRENDITAQGLTSWKLKPDDSLAPKWTHQA